eukprot:123916-Hanusia_phi.AAC.5
MHDVGNKSSGLKGEMSGAWTMLEETHQKDKEEARGCSCTPSQQHKTSEMYAAAGRTARRDYPVSSFRFFCKLPHLQSFPSSIEGPTPLNVTNLNL